MDTDKKHVGGRHYKETEFQHWNVTYERGWCYLVGSATKYLWRLGRKGDEAKKLEDVEKAIHYLEKKAEQLRAELGVGGPTRNYVDQG